MDSLPTSEFVFWTHPGERIEQPREWTPARVGLPVAVEAWGDAKFTVNGQAVELVLRRIDGEDCVVADWERSGTGRYRLIVESEGRAAQHTFSITPEKISEEAYRYLLEDLQVRLPYSIAIALQRGGALAGVEIRPPAKDRPLLAAEMGRLRRAIEGTRDRPGLAETLPRIADRVHRVMVTEEIWVRREKVRRPSPASLVRSFWRGENIETDGSLARVLDTRVEPSVDVYENRLVKVFVTQVERRLRRLVGLRQLNETIAAEGVALLKRLTVARRQSEFLENVTTPPYVPQRLTMVLMRVPPYRAAYEGYLEFNKTSYVTLDERRLESPLENLPGLYELRGTLQVIETVARLAETYGYRIRTHRLVRSRPSDIFLQVMPGGDPALVAVHPVTGVEVQVVPQYSYGRKSRPFRSLSFSQRPDISVIVTRPGQPPEIYLFDPKYKLDSEQLADGMPGDGRPKKVDIDKMHAYRDAIRGTDGERVVKFAGILYPGRDVEYGGKVQALRDYPGEATLRASLEAVLRPAMQIRN